MDETSSDHPLRILSLEDQPLDAELAREVLELSCCQVAIDVAADGQEFEAYLRDGQYDVILADYAVPGFDAPAALELAQAVCPATPFICVSGTIGEEATVEMLKKGADDCVLKDRMARLPFAVQRAIDDRAQRQALLERERQLAAVTENYPGVVLRLDGEQRILFAGGETLLWFGASPGDLIGRDAHELLGPAADPARRRPETPSDRRASLDARFLGPSGEPRYGLVTFTPDVGADGALNGQFVSIIDITEIRLANERLRGAVEGAVEAMGSMVNARDPYTGNHEKRVTRLAVAMAGQLGLGRQSVDGLRLAGLVHDVGKLTVPAEILTKPARLTEIEFELIKGHPEAAHEILKSIAFEQPVAEIVVQHHERQDGSGYPLGLTAASMLPEARILAVADVVEAMASHRPYRPALGLEAALEEVRSGAGRLYDAAAVAACETVFRQGFDLDQT